MVEAAFVAVRYDPRLKAIYDRIPERHGPMKARVAVARRMPVSIHHISGAFRPGPGRPPLVPQPGGPAVRDDTGHRVYRVA